MDKIPGTGDTRGVKAELQWPLASLSGTDWGGGERNYYPYRGRTFIRRVPVQKTPRTLNQSIAISEMGMVRGEWANLSDDDRRLWDAWGVDGYPGRARGSSGSPGYQAFLSVGVWRLRYGSPITGPPPVESVNGRVTVYVSWIAPLTNSALLEIHGSNHMTAVEEKIAIRLAGPFASPGRRPRSSDWRFARWDQRQNLLCDVAWDGVELCASDPLRNQAVEGDWVWVEWRLVTVEGLVGFVNTARYPILFGPF